MNFRKLRGQGAFEYILMLAGLLLVVLLILVVLQGTSGGASEDLDRKGCYNELLNNPGCYYTNGSFDTTGMPLGSTPSCVDIGAVNIGDADANIECVDLPANLVP
ncbi:MAG: hypothetical protein ACE5DI_03570 [Candidatus Micrarchaeia archaeon]